jgi:hypothetical protein
MAGRCITMACLNSLGAAEAGAKLSVLVFQICKTWPFRQAKSVNRGGPYIKKKKRRRMNVTEISPRSQPTWVSWEGQHKRIAFRMFYNLYIVAPRCRISSTLLINYSLMATCKEEISRTLRLRQN